MKCPICPDVALILHQRQGVEIDYCPQCRGIWLDRGELDKILERMAAETSATPAFHTQRSHHEERGRYDADDRRDYARYPSNVPPKRRKSLLSELLDFD